MALVNRAVGTPAGNTAGNKNHVPDKTFDIFSSEAPEGKKHKMDFTEDAWKRTAPPDMGRYSLQLFVGDPPVKMNLDKQGEFESYSISIMGRIVRSNTDADGAICFATVTTRVGRGKDISTVVGLLLKLGAQLKSDEMTDRQQAQFMLRALKQEPIIPNNLLDWQGSYSDVLADGRERWVNVATSQEEFPVNEDGVYQPQFSTTNRQGGRVDITAKLVVKEWGGRGSKKDEEAAMPVIEKEPVTQKAIADTSTPAPAAQPATKGKGKQKDPEPEPELDLAGDGELMLDMSE